MFEFTSIPEKPPRSISLLPGLKYSSIFDKSTIAAIISIVLLACIFPVAIFLSIEKNFRLPFIEMKKADGNITEIVESSKCDRKSVSIHYQFMTKTDRTYYGKYVSGQGNTYSFLNVGDIIPIVYDPDDPSFNGIEGEIGKNTPPPFIIILFPLLFGFIFFAMFFPNIKQLNDARSIFKNGNITKGEIVYIRRKKPTNAFNYKILTNLEVFYRFCTFSGESVETKAAADNDWLANKLEPGSSVTIVYKEKKPEKSIILDFYYR